MNKFSKLMIGMASAGGLLLSTAAVQAQGMGPKGGDCPMADGKGRMPSPERMAAHMDKHLAAMKKQLKITEQQEPLWQAFVEQKKKNMADMSKAFQENGGDKAKLSAPERMDQRSAMMKKHLEQHEASVESFKRLYAGLSAEQKVIADKYAAHPWGHGHGKGMRDKGMRGGMKNAAPKAEASTPQQQ